MGGDQRVGFADCKVALSPIEVTGYKMTKSICGVLKRFSVYDVKAGAYLPQFVSQSAGTAVRSFEAEVNREGSDFGKYAEDFTLFELGTWDPNTGKSDDLKAQLSLGTALSLKVNAPAIEMIPGIRGGE